MIVLTETTDKIQVVLGGSVTVNQLPCFATYRDITTSTYLAGRNILNTNSTTAVDVVDSPAASTQRVVDTLSIHNADTASAVVTVRFNANGTSYTLFSATLGVGEKIEYAEGQGFRVITNSGAVKTSLNQGNNAISTGMSIAVLAADVVNNNVSANSIADVVGLSFPVVANTKYWFRFVIPYTSAATTTGSRWSINGPSQSFLYFNSIYTLTATTITTNGGLSAYDTPAAANATSVATGNVAIIEGFITPTADGLIVARFASEITNSAITAKAGAVVFYQAIA